MKKKIVLMLGSVFILTLLDQIVKFIVDTRMKVGQSIPLIDGVFAFTYVRNEGAAWGSFSGKRLFLLIFTCIVLLLLIFTYIKMVKVNKFKALQILLVFLISGALGNIIDRIRLGYVIDIFDFCLINFPVFNVADIYVTCSVLIIFFLIIFKYDDEELEALFKKEKAEKIEK